MTSAYKLKWLKLLLPIHCIFLFFGLVSCHEETSIEVIPKFSFTSENEDYNAPVSIHIHNETSGANSYFWIFEGGIPRTSNKKDPGEIRYYKAGKYKIHLEARSDFQQSIEELVIEIDSSASIRFTSEILINNFSPAEIKIQNLSIGAEEYKWTFEGGNPSFSHEKDPPIIRYEQPGEYEIHLSAKSGRNTYTKTEKITLLAPLNTDFSLVPSIESEEMEAPWKGYLHNKTINGISYHWSSDGGKILNDTAFHTEIHFDLPGYYTINLEADNKKQKFQKSQTIHIGQNSNIYKFSDIKLGINTASYGYFFSSRLRKTFFQNEIDDHIGQNIDFAFFGLNSFFNYWTFLSPEKVQNAVFEPIKNAIQTKFILFPENQHIPLTIADFDEMKNDDKFRTIHFTSYSSEEEYFSSKIHLPKLVLLETQDGRKGVIKIKNIIDEGLESYIIVDIKIQKTSSD